MHEVRGTTAKPWRQKGSGRARAGSVRAPHWRGGGTVFGPVVRSHAHKLPKRVRRLAMKSALSSKQADGKLVILKDVAIKECKTKALRGIFDKLGWSNALIVGGVEIDHGEVDAWFREQPGNFQGAVVVDETGNTCRDRGIV